MPKTALTTSSIVRTLLFATIAIPSTIPITSNIGFAVALRTVAAAANCSRSAHSFSRGFAFGGASAGSSPSFDRSTTAMSSSMSSATEGCSIPKNLRGLFAGSGVEGLSNPLINAQILDLLPPEKKGSMNAVRVLYLGTATYDIAYFREKQTGRFVDRGCSVSSLDVAAGDVDLNAAAKAIREADVLLVGGGNTLFAVDRWNHLGLVPHLKRAMERGCILTGGSAGAICWFDSGHSDSADPDTYRTPMLGKYAKDESDKPKDESSDYDPADKKEWEYLRVPGLGFVPGPLVCCPHHDRVQSNGLLRARDFDRMLLERARSSSNSALGIGIDHYSAFIVQGDSYKIYALPDKPGSVSEAGAFDVDDDGTARGAPGVWLKRVIVAENGKGDGADLEVEAAVCPPEGKLVDILAYGGDNLPGQHSEEPGANQVAVDRCRSENPSGIEL